MQVQKRTDTLFGNTTVGRRELRRKQEIHRDRLRYSETCLNTQAPRDYPHISRLNQGGGFDLEKKKAKQAAETLERIKALAQARARSPGATEHGKHCGTLNKDARRFELDRITRENLQLVRQIETSKPFASTKDLLRRHQENRKYVINASHAMRLSGGYDEDLADLMQARRKAASRRPSLRNRPMSAPSSRGADRSDRPMSAPSSRGAAITASAPVVSMCSASSTPWLIMANDRRTASKPRVGIVVRGRTVVTTEPTSGTGDKSAIEACDLKASVKEDLDEEYNSDFVDESKGELSSSQACTLEGNLHLSSPQGAKNEREEEGGSYDDGDFHDESIAESTPHQQSRSLTAVSG